MNVQASLHISAVSPESTLIAVCTLRWERGDGSANMVKLESWKCAYELSSILS